MNSHGITVRGHPTTSGSLFIIILQNSRDANMRPSWKNMKLSFNHSAFMISFGGFGPHDCKGNQENRSWVSDKLHHDQYTLL